MVNKISQRKLTYRTKFEEHLRNYKTIIIVTANHVGSKQLQQIRQKLRGIASIVMGKNTMIRMIVRQTIPENPKLEKFLPHIQGNCGFVFTNDDIKLVRDILIENRVESIARPNVIAPNNVVVQAGPTGLDPGQTSFFQALNIGTKIVKGQVEITSKVNLIKKGDKVGNSECALLNKLGITPFKWGLLIDSIYSDGNVFKSEVLDLTPQDLMAKFMSSVRVTAALGFSIGIPNAASAPYSLASSFQKLLAISVESGFVFKESEKYKTILDDPEALAKFTSAASSANIGGNSEEKGGETKAEEKESSSESESSDGGACGLFGDSDSD